MKRREKERKGYKNRNKRKKKVKEGQKMIL